MDVNNDDLKKEEKDIAEGKSEAKELEEMVKELEQKVDENFKGWQRAAADLENFKKRSEQEKSELAAYAQERVIMEFLNVLEDLDRMLAYVPESTEKLKEWVNGMLLVRKRFDEAMRSMAVEKIKTVGEPFDPQKHEAVAQVDGGEAGIIAEEVASGYTRGGKLLKPAQVKVYKG